MVLKSEPVDGTTKQQSRRHNRNLQQSFLNEKLSNAFRILKLKRSLYKLRTQPRQQRIRKRVRKSFLNIVDDSSDLVTYDPAEMTVSKESRLPWETYYRKRKGNYFWESILRIFNYISAFFKVLAKSVNISLLEESQASHSKIEKLNKYEKLRRRRSGLQLKVTRSDLKLHQSQSPVIKTGANLKSFLLNTSLSLSSSDESIEEEKSDKGFIVTKALSPQDIVARVLKTRPSVCKM